MRIVEKDLNSLAYIIIICVTNTKICFGFLWANEIKWNWTLHINTLLIHKTAIFSNIRSYYIEKMSSCFPSEVLRLLGLNPVIHGRSWEQPVPACRPKLQLQHRGVSVFLSRSHTQDTYLASVFHLASCCSHTLLLSSYIEFSFGNSPQYERVWCHYLVMHLIHI